MEGIFAASMKQVLGVLLRLIASSFVRWVVSKIRIKAYYYQFSEWLEKKKFRVPVDALTHKKIINHKVIKAVDSAVISDPVRRDIERKLGDWCLIRREWDSDLSTPLTFKWKEFFQRSDRTLAERVAPSLAELYQERNIACFVILPFPRDKKHKPLESFQRALEERLGSREIKREWLAPAILDGKIPLQWTSRVRQGEGILILQPMAMNDQYIEKVVTYINENSMGSIIEVVTVVDGSARGINGRSKSPPERILIELDLHQPM